MAKVWQKYSEEMSPNEVERVTSILTGNDVEGVVRLLGDMQDAGSIQYLNSSDEKNIKKIVIHKKAIYDVVGTIYNLSKINLKEIVSEVKDVLIRFFLKENEYDDDSHSTAWRNELILYLGGV